MKSVVITSLSNAINLIESSSLINNLTRENPDIRTTVITFSDLKNHALLLGNIGKLVTIDRLKIEGLLSGKLYSDAFAFNLLFENLKDVFNQDWDLAINFSNDEISAQIIPLLNCKEISGSTVHENGSAGTSSRWSAIRNFYSTRILDQEIQDTYLQARSAGINHYIPDFSINLSPDLSMVATKNFSKIRSELPRQAQLIGINLANSDSNNFFELNQLIELVDNIEYSEHHKCILIAEPNNQSWYLVNELNKEFNNTLLTIKMDTTAAPSVLSNLDWLITQPNSLSILAQSLETRVIEIVERNERATLVREGNYFVRKLSEDNIVDDVSFIINKETDLSESLPLPVTKSDSSHATYISVADENGIYRSQVRGELSIEKEVHYHFKRIYTKSVLNEKVDLKSLNLFKDQLDFEIIVNYIEKAKSEVTDVTKTLLATLRSLQSIKSSNKNASRFLSYLEQLMSLGAEDIFCQSAICLFEASVENISTSDTGTNMKKMETALYKLKSDLQVSMKLFEHLLHDEARSVQKEL